MKYRLAKTLTRPQKRALEAAVDELIGPYDEDEPEKGGSWARELGSKYPIGGDWGKVQRPPEEDERNYFIYGGPPKKKQREARESLVAEGKPLGTHAAKEIRCVGLLKLVRNLLAHKTEHVESGRFESEAAIADYRLLPVVASVAADDRAHAGRQAQRWDGGWAGGRRRVGGGQEAADELRRGPQPSRLLAAIVQYGARCCANGSIGRGVFHARHATRQPSPPQPGARPGRHQA